MVDGWQAMCSVTELDLGLVLLLGTTFSFVFHIALVADACALTEMFRVR